MPALTITRSSSWEEFEAGVEEAHALIQRVGIPTDIDRTRNEILAKFAQREGIDVAEAERVLRSNSVVQAEPEPLTPEDEEKREAAVEERARAVATRQTAASGRPYFYVNPKDLAFLKMVTTMKKAGNVVANTLFTGPTGCGKTTLAQEVGFQMGIPVHIVNCPSITSDEKWVGHKEFRDGKTDYVLSELLRWVSTPGDKIVVFDELTRLHPTRHNILFPMLDNQQSIWVPELDIHVDVVDTIFWATANIGVGYTGTHRMDNALSGRFGFRLEMDFPEPKQEQNILEQRTGINAAESAILVDIAGMTRARHRSGDLDESVSTRNLLDASILVAAGMSIPEAAEYTFVRFFSEEGGTSSQRVQVRQMVTGKAGGKKAK